MSKNETLKFYIVDEKYIQYLSKFDNHVCWNKNQKRPYIGIVLKVNNCLYFAPLYSYKEKYDKYRENHTYIRVCDRKGRNISIVRFSEMIPVPKCALNKLNFEIRGNKYRDLLQTEINFINDNKDIIYYKANKVYSNVVNKKIPFFTSLSCNFKLLEQKLKMYNKKI